MSLCVETSNVLATSMGTSASSVPLLEESTTQSTQSTISTIASQATISTNILQAPITAIQSGHDKLDQQLPPAKSIAKLVVANHAAANNCGALLQKVNPPLNITVLNPSGPLTVVKTLCVTSGVSSTPQFTLVNSTPLNVTNAIGKPPTFTLLNAPVTVVKAIAANSQQTLEKNGAGETSVVVNNQANVGVPPAPSIIENRGHNVFVKNTCPDSTVQEMPQGHKLLTANSFPTTNVLTNVTPQSKTANGQRNKLKILSNVVMPGTSQSVNNVLLNKTNTPRFVPRQKIVGPNGAPTKYMNKQPLSTNPGKPNVNSPPVKLMQDKSPTRMLYPTHKSQIKTIPPVNNYVQKPQQGVAVGGTGGGVGGGIKTIPPQQKNVPGQVQRTGSGLRTIPPQRPPKVPNKANYIGKHAVQAQKMRQTHGKVKGIKMPSIMPYNVHVPVMPDKQLTELTFNQALTAQILETLSNTNTPMPSNRYEILPARYDNAFNCPEPKQQVESPKPAEDKTKSGLDALSLICQAVLLDHNYNATLPPDSPTRPSPPNVMSAQVNGVSPGSVYSPNTIKRRSLPSSNTISSTSSLSSISITPSNNSLNNVQDDDAASDISDGSDRKHDTEGEETDTAPEAEAVNNDNFDGGYGDYVTRCICDFLHDDGYMVECDKCKVWQHVQCVVKNRQIPDEYLCEVCDPSKPVDRQKARLIQQQWLRDRQFIDPKLKKDPKVKEIFKPKETVTDTDSSDGEQAVQNNVMAKGRGTTNRRKSESHQKQNAIRQRREAAKEVVQRRQKRRERKIVRKKAKNQVKSHSDDENQDVWASNLPQLRQWIEKYEEAVTNHYSPELRARISSIRVNGAHSDLSMQFDSTVHKCRVHTQPLTELKYLVSTVNLPPNTPVIELRGKYMLSTQHRNSGGSLTTRQHSQRPGPFLFFYRLHKDNTEVCVDTRTYGNAARFIRRSCKPNAELRHCIEKGVLHLYIVSIINVDKNCELTIKHESHDLAAIGTTQIACACGNSDECLVNKSPIKKNGEVPECNTRKRRGRRTVSSHLPEVETPKVPKEEPPRTPSPPPAPPAVPVIQSPVKLKPEKVEKPEVNIKPEPELKMEVEELKVEEKPVKEEIPVIKEEPVEVKVKEELPEERPVTPPPPQEIKKESVKEEEIKSPPLTPVSTRRSSYHKSDREDEKSSDTKEEKLKCKKLSREERKLEAILKAIEKMEKAESRKQEHQAKQAAHRRESEPGPNNNKEDDKQEPKMKRRRRKGRARTISQSATRRNRLNSTDSYMTSGDENLLSPNDNSQPAALKSSICKEDIVNEQCENNRAVGLLLALSNGDNKQEKSPPPPLETDSNSNSAHSSPETHLSSACLLVQAAVEPLEPGFKFPKTKKGLMNEWLNKVPDPVQPASSISPNSLTPHVSSSTDLDMNSFYSTPSKNLAALAQAAAFCDVSLQPRGSAKKRWLRQAISEDHSCDSPSSRPDSPPLSDMVAPPKKRRLPRESLSNDASPPTTPTGHVPPLNKSELDRNNQHEGCVEIVCSMMDGDSPTHTLESEAILKERAAKMKQEFSMVSSLDLSSSRSDISHLGGLLDPRLSRESRIFPSNTDLIGTVEKTLSILGLENAKPEPAPVTPKRKVKLSISEYRQRKMLNFNDKNDEQEHESESIPVLEETNSSESFKGRATPIPRHRSGSTSSSTSLSSSDDEFSLNDIPVKAPVFNSEPTELERQREISSMRLKKVFGLSVDETRPAIDVQSILNLELEPKVKSMPLPSPTFPIPGSVDVLPKHSPSPHPPPSPPSLPTSPPLTPQATSEEPSASAADAIPEEEITEAAVNAEDGVVSDSTAPTEDGKTDDPSASNFFYTPDEEENEEVVTEREQPVCEEPESVSYVPPFNNPIYPNDSFTSYTSAMDDDARYEGRNPSPPPNL